MSDAKYIWMNRRRCVISHAVNVEFFPSSLCGMSDCRYGSTFPDFPKCKRCLRLIEKANKQRTDGE
jgi:hypothetical protein